MSSSSRSITRQQHSGGLLASPQPPSSCAVLVVVVGSAAKCAWNVRKSGCKQLPTENKRKGPDIQYFGTVACK